MTLSSPIDRHTQLEISQESDNPSQMDEKVRTSEERVEVVKDSGLNVTYDNVDEEPSIHIHTYIALAAMFMLNLVQLVALQGPPTFVCQDLSQVCCY